MGLLYAAGLRGRFARLLGRELLAWGLATGGLAGGLLHASQSISQSVRVRVLERAILRAITNLGAGHCRVKRVVAKLARGFFSGWRMMFGWDNRRERTIVSSYDVV
jgi:hypothetical protein